MSVVKLKKEKQKKVKALSQGITAIAAIGKILALIAIPLLFVGVIAIPIVFHHVNIEENAISFQLGEDTFQFAFEESADWVTIKWNDEEIERAETGEDVMEVLRWKSFLLQKSKTVLLFYLESALLVLILILVLYFLIFSHLEKLFKNIFVGVTPFTLENVEHIKKMAYFMIATIVLPIIGGTLFEMAMHADLNVGIETTNLLEILFLFSMAYIFEYGYEIQRDSKGVMYGDENE